MSTSKRYSTVHDFASLRLRPDGSRITRKQAEGKSEKYSTYTVKDPRGNWVAKDAGGLGRVKTRYAVSQEREDEEHDSQGQDEGEENDEDWDNSSSAAKRDKGKTRALEADLKALKGSRAKRRRLFFEDIGIDGPGSAELSQVTLPSATPNLENAEGAGPSSLHARPTPSSDLLKCIHYFASTYYSEMGQLRDSAKEARQEQKLRRLDKLKRRAAPKTTKLKQGLQKDTGTRDEDSETDSSGENISDTEEGSTASRAKKVSKRRRAKLPVDTDMYKIFDGSALMAIGMLLQHHVEGLVAPQIPKSWEEGMQGEAERLIGETMQTTQVKNRETEDIVEVYRPKLSQEASAELLVDGVLPVHDDTDDEDYVPE